MATDVPTNDILREGQSAIQNPAPPNSDADSKPSEGKGQASSLVQSEVGSVYEQRASRGQGEEKTGDSEEEELDSESDSENLKEQRKEKKVYKKVVKNKPRMSIIDFNQDIEQPIMQPGNVFGENTEPIRPELYDLLRHWVTERAHAENSLVAAGVPRRNINPSQDQVLRSHYNDEMIILNEKLERVQWPPDNPSTILVNSANVRHAHGGGVAKSIADMFPVEVLEHVQRLRMPLLPHSTTFHPVPQGTTPIVKVQGVIHHAWMHRKSLLEDTMENLRYHLHMSYAGPYMALTALRHVKPIVKGKPFQGEQVVLTLHGAGLYEYPWEEAARACLVWSRNFILMGIRVVVLIPDKHQAERFTTMWNDFVTGDRIFESTQTEREVKESSEALFWVSQVGTPDAGAIKEIWAMRQGLNPANVQTPSKMANEKQPIIPAAPSTGLYPILIQGQTLTEGKKEPKPPAQPTAPPAATPQWGDETLFRDPDLAPYVEGLGDRTYKMLENLDPLPNRERNAYSAPDQGRFNINYGTAPRIPPSLFGPPYNPQCFTDGRQPVSGNSDIQNEPPIPPLVQDKIRKIHQAHLDRRQEEYAKEKNWLKQVEELNEIQARLRWEAALRAAAQGPGSQDDLLRMHNEPPVYYYGKGTGKPVAGGNPDPPGKPKVSSQNNGETGGDPPQFPKEGDNEEKKGQGPKRPPYPDMYRYEILNKKGCCKIIVAQAKERHVLTKPPVPIDYMWVISEGLNQLPTDQQHVRGFCGRVWQKEMERLSVELTDKDKEDNMWLLRHQFDNNRGIGPEGTIPPGYALMHIKKPVSVGEYKSFVHSVIEEVEKAGGGVVLRASPPKKIGGMQAATQREIWYQGLNPKKGPNCILILCEVDKNRYESMLKDLLELFSEVEEHVPSPIVKGKVGQTRKEVSSSEEEDTEEEPQSEEEEAPHEDWEGNNSDGEGDVQHIVTMVRESAPKRKGKNMAVLETHAKPKKKSKEPRSVRGLNARSKPVKLREIDLHKPPIAKKGVYVTNEGKTYGPFIEDLNEDHMKEKPKDCYEWYEPDPQERLSQRRLPSSERIYAMSGVAQPWKHSYVAQHYDWMRQGIEKRDRSVERHYSRQGRAKEGEPDSESEEEYYSNYDNYGKDKPGRGKGVIWDDEPMSEGEDTVTSRILARSTPAKGRKERGRKLIDSPECSPRKREGKERQSASSGMTVTEILQLFPNAEEGETPPEYVLRVYDMGIGEEMLKDKHISTMVAINKNIPIPRAMTLWDVKQVKTVALGKDKIDELKKKHVEQVTQGKSTLCLAVACLEEAGASDIQMEDFFVQLPGGDSLAVIWRTGSINSKAKAITEWELRRQLREEKKAKNAKAGAPPALAKGGRPEEMRQTENRNQDNRPVNNGQGWNNGTQRDRRDSQDRRPQFRNRIEPNQHGQRRDQNQNRRNMPYPENRREERPSTSREGQESRPQGTWRSGNNPNTIPRTYLGRPLKEGAPMPPSYIPKERFFALPKEEKDRVQREKDEYIRRWLIS